MWSLISNLIPGVSQLRIGIYLGLALLVTLAVGYAYWKISSLEYDLLQTQSDLTVSQMNEKKTKEALDNSNAAIASAQKDIQNYVDAQAKLTAEKEALSLSLTEANKRLRALDLTLRRNNETQQQKLLDDINKRNGTFDLGKRLQLVQ